MVPGRDALRVDPLPMGLASAGFSAVLRGRVVTVDVEGETVRVKLGGVERETSLGTPLEVPW